ncbi:MAG: glycosyltransferase family 2 protein [Bacteroidia bacterium]|nr:glycosyltransferase family 2 protein [Bacteroidia bacterium]
MNTLAPIALFVYRRPWHTRQTLESLASNPLSRQSELFIFADAPPANAPDKTWQAVAGVRQLIRERAWCGKVHIREATTPKGLAASIVEGVSEVVNRYGKIIVLEDDLYLSPGFLQYMNDALVFYTTENQVMHINGYMYPLKLELPETFFYNVISSWGWATWQRAWQAYCGDAQKLWQALQDQKRSTHFDLQNSGGLLPHLLANVEGQINTWAIKWYASVYLRQGYCLCPRQSLVQNLGFDASGTHAGSSRVYEVPQLAPAIRVGPIPLVEHQRVRQRMRAFYRYGGIGLSYRWQYWMNLTKTKIYYRCPVWLRRLYGRLKPTGR